jgi:hypothetical protein
MAISFPFADFTFLFLKTSAWAASWLGVSALRFTLTITWQ